MFGYYPADHAGGGEILRHCGRGMVFGDVSSTRLWQGDPRIEVHGPGYSKIVIGEDCIDDWEKYLDVMVASILENSGRSLHQCVGSVGAAPCGGDRRGSGAAAGAGRPAAMRRTSRRRLAPFADAGVAGRIAKMIDADLDGEGAHDVTAAYRRGRPSRGLRRLLLPAADHRALRFAASMRWPTANSFSRTRAWCRCSRRTSRGRSVRAWWSRRSPDDRSLIGRLLASPHVGRLNLGGIPTCKISWDQPHEGNLFDHLYARRAFQLAV